MEGNEQCDGELLLGIKLTDTTYWLTRHATNEYGACVKIGKRFTLSHTPMELASIERVTVGYSERLDFLSQWSTQRHLDTIP